MTIRDYTVSLLRTLVPALVAYVLAGLAAAGVEVDGAALEIVLTGVILGAYYSLLRVAERRWPAVGVLLGWPAAPSYDGAKRLG